MSTLENRKLVLTIPGIEEVIPGNGWLRVAGTRIILYVGIDDVFFVEWRVLDTDFNTSDFITSFFGSKKKVFSFEEIFPMLPIALQKNLVFYLDLFLDVK